MSTVPLTSADDNRRVVVIGSGPSGAIAALHLLRQGIPVTMLESGQTLPRGLFVRLMGRTVYRKWPPLDIHNGYLATDDPDAVWHHTLTPGGLSNNWTGAVPRFAPEDFTEGERLHEQYRWPVSYEDLEPYYEQLERLLVVSAGTKEVPHLPAACVAYPRQLPSDWQQLDKQARLRGRAFAPVPLATGHDWMVRRSGAGFNSFLDIVQKLLRFPRFQLILGAHALRLEWSGDKKCVQSVVYFDRSTTSEQRLSASAFVVAAGAMASTKLLLDSSCADFPSGLGDTEGILGHYLHDHVHDWYLVELDKPLSRLTHTACLTRAPYDESPPLLATTSTFGRSPSTVDKVLALTPTKTNRFGIVTFGTVVPLHKNQVRLDATSKDEFGLPKLDVHARYDNDVRRNMETARAQVLAIMESGGYRCTLIEESMRLTPGWTFHSGGTVRMHSSPKYGMLNAWNRLHLVDNVVVADASSFTTGAEKNPTLTAMALAARAADRLAVDLKTS